VNSVETGSALLNGFSIARACRHFAHRCPMRGFSSEVKKSNE
jgi:hypothetical protein